MNIFRLILQGNIPRRVDFILKLFRVCKYKVLSTVEILKCSRFGILMSR